MTWIFGTGSRLNNMESKVHCKTQDFSLLDEEKYWKETSQNAYLQQHQNLMTLFLQKNMYIQYVEQIKMGYRRNRVKETRFEEYSQLKE